MAKFLDKKEQAIDFQLTPYGKYKLSVGKFKPAYYSFFDTNVLYDSQYAGFKETQNNTHKRIKTDTSYLEGILSFEELENSVPPTNLARTQVGISEDLFIEGILAIDDLIGDVPQDKVDTSSKDLTTLLYGVAATWIESTTRTSMFDLDIAPEQHIPRAEQLQFDAAIGDAHFDGKNTQTAPAWKVITCQGEITKSRVKDSTRYAPAVSGSAESLEGQANDKEFNIPQVDVTLYYTKTIDKPESQLFADGVSQAINQTPVFKDGNVIRLVKNDLVVYADEVNTEILNENFDIEVFEVSEQKCGADADCAGFSKCRSGVCTGTTELNRKYFESIEPQIVDGLMKYENPRSKTTTELTENAVEYYFDVRTDSQIDPKIGCRCANTFNKSSYYIDIDFECEDDEETLEYYDIYGSVTVPDICYPEEEDTTTTEECELEEK
ncbi:hypothetical protein CMI37_00990 [Candidatus Pacearchaeota archaeon]|nr:hypothetical protein [Candidatus Pacearchaeota archaeon]